jgi:hypothetical protein
MYATVGQYTINPGQDTVGEAARDVQGGLEPILNQAPVAASAHAALTPGGGERPGHAHGRGDDDPRTTTPTCALELAAFASSPPNIAEGEVIAHQVQ